MSLKVFLAIPVLFCLTGCGPAKEKGNQGSEANNLIYTAKEWRAAVDPFGSSFRAGDPLVQDGQAEVFFTIATIADENDSRTPYLELICDIGHSLETFTGARLVYQCGSDLLVKLSQKDFGPEGNETYSHYQFRLPPSGDWTEAVLHFENFSQPDWSPAVSRTIPLNLGHVDAIYLVPDLDFTIGESTTLKVQHLELF